MHQLWKFLQLLIHRKDNLHPVLQLLWDMEDRLIQVLPSYETVRLGIHCLHLFLILLEVILPVQFSCCFLMAACCCVNSKFIVHLPFFLLRLILFLLSLYLNAFVIVCLSYYLRANTLCANYIFICSFCNTFFLFFLIFLYIFTNFY